MTRTALEKENEDVIRKDDPASVCMHFKKQASYVELVLLFVDLNFIS